MEKGVTDGGVGIFQRRNGLRGVDGPAAGGQAFEPEPLAVPEQRGRGGAVDLEDESWPGHWLPTSLLSEIEGHLHGAPAAGGGGMLDCVGEAVEGIEGTAEPLEARIAHQV